jgi:hypothetical protein
MERIAMSQQELDDLEWLKRAKDGSESQSRWTVRTLAREVGLPHSTVQTILHASELQLHRIRTFTFSPDPDWRTACSDPSET